jgi:hypothetical protein
MRFKRPLNAHSGIIEYRQKELLKYLGWRGFPYEDKLGVWPSWDDIKRILHTPESPEECILAAADKAIAENTDVTGYMEVNGKCVNITGKSKSHTEEVSDGGHSKYYDLTIKGTECKVEDVIREVFGNDFDMGNMLKCLVRIQRAKEGRGKAGASIEYDLNKIIYTCNKLKELLNEG